MSNTSSAVFKFQAPLISPAGMLLLGFTVGTEMVGSVAEMKADPNCVSISSVKLRFVRSTVPLF